MRVGIVGCGAIGAKRAEAALATGNQVCMVCDPETVRAETLAATTGAKIASGWQQLVSSDLDAVVIATPHNLLASIGLAALTAGKHVLIEKPGARTARELEPLASLAKERSLVAKVGFNHRFHPAIAAARKLVDEESIGPLLFIRGRYGHGGRPGYATEWRSDPEISGGGELIDQGSHLIDLARWFLGELKIEYGALPTYFWETAVDDNCFLALRSGGGRLAWLHASWTEWKNLFSFEVFGRDGKLAVEGLGGSYGVERLAYYRMRPEMGPPDTTIWEYPLPDQSFRTEFDEFAAAVAERRQPLGNLDDALAVLRIVDQLYKRS
jgi:predicted dehydrogenase